MIEKLWKEEQEKYKRYLSKLGKEIGYTGRNCVNCGRNRVLRYTNGKEICEKCCFDQNKKEYDFLYDKIFY